MPVLLRRRSHPAARRVVAAFTLACSGAQTCWKNVIESGNTKIHGCGECADREGENVKDRGSVELGVVAIGLFLLVSLTLMVAVNLITAQAATTAAQRGVQIVQTPNGSPDEARQVMQRITTSSGMISSSSINISGTPDTVTVSIATRTVLGQNITRVATGPRLKFIPQSRP